MTKGKFEMILNIILSQKAKKETKRKAIRTALEQYAAEIGYGQPIVMMGADDPYELALSALSTFERISGGIIHLTKDEYEVRDG